MYFSRKLKLLFRKHCLVTSNAKCEFSMTLVQRKINKILIANRGEIACRILKTAKKLGVKTAAVYSDTDRNSMHVDLADEAYSIGPAPAGQSYLRQDKIIAVCKKAKCQAIHPGYGFLSENAEFADLCHKENIIFIGPPADAIREMGIKSASKRIMSKAGVPVVEGYHGDDQTDNTLLSEAKRIGFPLMIKAVRGGGGKGMRIAMKESDFTEALESARVESQKAFGDSSVLLEKYILEPRHIEVQIFADKYGNAVHLFERDCSVQRRHQKIIEEAPAPGISQELRTELGASAVRAAKAVGYVGAGTVEFIMDRYTHSFHFMEMNTRLQVEHPVTEAITGTDLVEWQLNVAAGEKLPLTQEEISFKGHAFEARIYAEDPKHDFLPGAGTLLYLTTPEASKNVRIETGVRQNDEVSVYYDPMIAKLVVWGKDRNEALGILRGKLSEYNIVGVETNVEFLKDLSTNPKFENGEVHTGFIEENRDSLFRKLQVPAQILCQGAFALILLEELNSLKSSLKTKDSFSPFVTETGVRLNHTLDRRITLKIDDNEFIVDIKYTEPEVYLMRSNNIGPWRKVTGTLTKEKNILKLDMEVDDVVTKARIVEIKDDLYLFTHDRKWQLTIIRPKFVTVASAEEITAGAAISPMPGIVNKIFVKHNDFVRKDDPLLVVIAMKMEYIIRASSDGKVVDILCSVGDNVAKNKLLVKLAEVPKDE